VNGPAVTRGARELRRLLCERTFDLRGLDAAGFRRWLAGHLARWRNDPVFIQRARIRDLRQTYPNLLQLEHGHNRAAAADAASPQFARLRQVEQELVGAGNAVAGLTAALEQAEPEKRPALREKLGAFQARRQALDEEQAALLRASPQRQTLLRIALELRALRAVIGLDGEEARLDELLKQRGRRSGRSGESFEQLALTLTHNHILPELVRGGEGDGAAPRLRVVTGVTLGAARTEFDQLVIRQPLCAATTVEVLAAVEVKRNINDLAHGFRRRQEDLAWLTGESGRYNPRAFRTRRFPAGHFDRESLHRQDGEDFVFSPGSFRRFRREASGPAAASPGQPASLPQAGSLAGGPLGCEGGPFLKRLYFITRPGPLWGVSAAGLARVSFRAATDERWAPEDDAYLDALLRWCQALAAPTETPDVLRLFAAAPRRARQILVVGE
jgi:hypothetical protein